MKADSIADPGRGRGPAGEAGQASAPMQTRRPGRPGLLDQIHEDWAAHGRGWTKPGFHAVVVYRLGAWLRHQPRPARALLGPILKVLSTSIRNLYGIELPAESTIGRRFIIAHQSGIVIHPNVVIGDDCAIRQNVTLGAATMGRAMDHAPKLGNGVWVGAGAVILGKVTVGDGARIGPNVVVTMSVPPGATVFASPPRVMVPSGKMRDHWSATE